MLRIIAAGLMAVFAATTISTPADAARQTRFTSKSVSYGSAIKAGSRRSASYRSTTTYRSAITYRSATSYNSRARMVSVVGIRDRAVSPFGRNRANGPAFFEDVGSRATF